jgi:hypothetical protein|tara:strand:- start:350 stop:532 length:183 start_codon:yes stop_codon:yes gene_type:complete
MKYKILEIETGKTFVWSVSKILEEINRDHSDEFLAYDKSDWREGWDEWCEGNFYSLIKKI